MTPSRHAMIRINCNVSGVPTDTPVLQLDTAPEVYSAVLSEGRAVFILPAATPPHGATVRWSTHTAWTVIPTAPGSYEGGLLNPPLPPLAYPTLPVTLPRLRIDGLRFVTETGQRWIWAGCTDFLLYRSFLEDRDLSVLLQERRTLGANLVRVLGMAHYIERFYPQEWVTHGYYEQLGPFARLLARHGLYLEFVTFADQQEVRINEQEHFRRCCDALRPEPNVVVELCNEYPKNGIDPRRFSRPAGILASAGSSTADEAPAVFWDFFGWHGRRDWPKVTSSCEDMWYVIQKQRVPGVHDEPARRDRPPEYDQSLAAQLGATARVLGAGATFHSPEGIRSAPFSAQTHDDALAFFLALKGDWHEK